MRRPSTGSTSPIRCGAAGLSTSSTPWGTGELRGGAREDLGAALTSRAGLVRALDPVRQAWDGAVRPDQTPDLEMRADDLRAVLDAVGSERAVVLGDADAGALAAFFAAAPPGTGAGPDPQRRLRAEGVGARLPDRADGGGLPRGPSKTWCGAGERRSWHRTGSMPRRRRSRTTRSTSSGSPRPCATARPRRPPSSSRTRSTPSMCGRSSGPCRRRPSCWRSPVLWTRRRARTRSCRPDPRREVRRASRAGLHHGAHEPGAAAGCDRRVHPIGERRGAPRSTGSWRPCCSPTSWARPSGRRDSGTERGRTSLERHHEVVRAMIGRYRGAEINTAGDGFLATFDGPARGVQMRPGDRRGGATLGSRSAPACTPVRSRRSTGRWAASRSTPARASAPSPDPPRSWSRRRSRIWSRAPGSTFEDAGEHELKGVPDRWRLYRVVS